MNKILAVFKILVAGYLLWLAYDLTNHVMEIKDHNIKQSIIDLMLLIWLTVVFVVKH